MASTTTTAAEETTTTGAAAATGACALITPVDILAALDVTVRDGSAFDNGDVETCSYASIDPPIAVVIGLAAPGGQLLEDALAGDPDAVDYPGVGDGAVLQIQLGRITVRVGETDFWINVMPAPSEAALVQLARTAVGQV